MQQAWTSFWMNVSALFEAALMPFQAAARLVGLNPSIPQNYFFLVAAGFATLLFIHLYGDIVVLRRGRRTTGTVVGIDPGDDSPDRPIIRFRDASGREFTFTSDLSCNDTTRRIGATVEVDYDPAKPSRVREAGRPLAKLLYIAVLTFIAGLPLTAIFIVE
ncbi:DUF3592 domain-containing protein [Bradyrhizobium liaoningense]|uniref:DUF3592 domain-containing protein n=1 Tax=Bradyrhizobium liaoningense TaxID=43992 RepID=UPI001BA570F9|nr:DUF3592 domain-containing protein [Bradyrhizobium liaoningense]MBR0839313.1 DUF3592 domain-containing protein [Bradyrhizobium liaoningense]